MNLINHCLKCFSYSKEEIHFESEGIQTNDLDIEDVAKSIIHDLIQTQDEYTKIFESKKFFRLIYRILMDKSERNIEKEINEYIDSRLNSSKKLS